MEDRYWLGAQYLVEAFCDELKDSPIVWLRINIVEAIAKQLSLEV